MNKYRKDMVPAQMAEYVTHPTPAILEIGCNDGTDTNAILETFPRGMVYCFEPDPRAIARFNETIHHRNRVRLEQVAVSNANGIATFHGSSGRPPEHRRNINHYTRLPEWDLSGSLCKPTGHLDYSPWTTFPIERQIEVRTVKLDSWMKQVALERIDFIWADVQGAEHLLIEGATETLKLTHYFYTEYEKKEMYEGELDLDGIRAMLPGFDLVALYGTTNALFRNKELPNA